MAEQPGKDNERQRDNDKLRDLESRLAQMRKPAEPSRGEQHFTQANMAWRMVIELVSGLGIGFVIGYGIDYLAGTMPIFLVLFVLLGLAAGIKTMLATARDIGRKLPDLDRDRANGQAPAAKGTEGGDD